MRRVWAIAVLAVILAQEQQRPGDAEEVWPLWALLGGLLLAIGGLATWTTRRRRR